MTDTRRPLALVDVLINNAGLGANGSFVESDPARHAEMLQVNVQAAAEIQFATDANGFSISNSPNLRPACRSSL